MSQTICLKPFCYFFFSSVFASSVRLAMSGDDFKKLVSSAKRLVKKDVARGIDTIILNAHYLFI